MIFHVANNLYRGPRPKSFADLRPWGIRHVVNLQSGAYDWATATGYEHEFASDFGMVETEVKCSDFFPPSGKAVEEFLGIVTDSQTVYVHCLHGMDRTGYVCAAYRMRVCGWSWKQAVSEMFSFGFHRFPYLWWVGFLKKYQRRISQ